MAACQPGFTSCGGGCMPAGATCCPSLTQYCKDGGACCGGGKCAPTQAQCTGSSCPSGKKKCDDGCISSSATCCNAGDNTFCKSGVCCPNSDKCGDSIAACSGGTTPPPTGGTCSCDTNRSTIHICTEAKNASDCNASSSTSFACNSGNLRTGRACDGGKKLCCVGHTYDTFLYSCSTSGCEDNFRANCKSTGGTIQSCSSSSYTPPNNNNNNNNSSGSSSGCALGSGDASANGLCILMVLLMLGLARRRKRSA